MQGKLRKNEIGRWEIVNESGERVELSSGDVIDIYSVAADRWSRTRIEHNGRDYVAVNGLELFTGRVVRETGIPRFNG